MRLKLNKNAYLPRYASHQRLYVADAFMNPAFSSTYKRIKRISLREIANREVFAIPPRCREAKGVTA